MTVAATSNGQKQNESVQSLQIEKQKIEEKSPDGPYRPITFPTSDEDENTRDKFPPQKPSQNQTQSQSQNQAQNANLILQSVDSKLPAPSPSMELTRPTRVAAVNAPEITSRYTDDQLDYIRDFSWTLFQVRCFVGKLCIAIANQTQLKSLMCFSTGIKTSIGHWKLGTFSHSTPAAVIPTSICCRWSY